MHKCVSNLRRETGAKQVGQARGDNHVFLCAALPLRGADTETSGRPAPSVQPGMSAEAVQNQNVITWAGLYRRWTPGGAGASEPSPVSFTLQLSLQYLLESAFKDIKIQYQARFTALFNLNTSITMQLETSGRFTVIFYYFYIYITRYSLLITFEKITLAPFFVEQLEIGKAARKAVGELDVILGWLQDAEQKSLS